MTKTIFTEPSSITLHIFTEPSSITLYIFTEPSSITLYIFTEPSSITLYNIFKNYKKGQIMKNEKEKKMINEQFRVGRGRKTNYYMGKYIRVLARLD